MRFASGEEQSQGQGREGAAGTKVPRCFIPFRLKLGGRVLLESGVWENELELQAGE